mmetsp:Transcript_2346/g.9185  ORF Transcript_2346/g.9185 Transcript_2346/m.9185 type:complete len:217 (-) Transcript_2346:533-1183(-)
MTLPPGAWEAALPPWRCCRWHRGPRPAPSGQAAAQAGLRPPWRSRFPTTTPSVGTAAAQAAQGRALQVAQARPLRTLSARARPSRERGGADISTWTQARSPLVQACRRPASSRRQVRLLRGPPRRTLSHFSQRQSGPARCQAQHLASVAGTAAAAVRWTPWPRARVARSGRGRAGRCPPAGETPTARPGPSSARGGRGQCPRPPCPMRRAAPRRAS